MAKRKAVASDDEDGEDFVPENSRSATPDKPVKDKPKTVKKPKFKKEEEEEDQLDSEEEEAPLSKKPKAAEKKKNKRVKSESNDDSGDIVVRSTAEGEKYVDLGKKKRATVRSFKGQVFVDIREFYGADGEEKPGKKGISLNRDQWETLKRSADTLDSLFADFKK
ncbi:hypothetical protein PLICRDRAFT_50835 [Plicaturopsis crispa FD-325 SS-3]|nr:hypothetical protein PLICRDRAFT_50835 [Plicaturopsis crispa FD-325 SS-3]